MAGKFHVNAKGEVGECRSEKDMCPFGGGEAQHYSTPEKARQAYELSMAPETLATTVPAKSQGNNFDPLGHVFHSERWGGFSKEDLDFNIDEVWRSVKNSSWGADLNEPQIHALVSKRKMFWEAKARTEPAGPSDRNVPIRLIPTGSEVVIDRNRYNKHGKVGTPVDNGVDENSGESDIVGKYRDIAGQWDYVSPDTTFDVSSVPLKDGEVRLSTRWKAANEKAGKLAEMRGKWRELKMAAIRIEQGKEQGLNERSL